MSPDVPAESQFKELRAIRNLLALHLLKCGTSQGEVGNALSLDQSNVSRMFPNVQKYRWANKNSD